MKDIPQPGQTLQRGFSGFFTHLTQSVEQLAKKGGYSHVTAVPTWTYVWHAFVERGYMPTDADQDNEVQDFFRRIGSVAFPKDIAQQDSQLLSSLPQKHPLISWMSVAPFALQLNPDYVPHLGLDEAREKRFQEIFHNLKNAVQSEEGLKTYPLSPGRNLWLSKKL